MLFQLHGKGVKCLYYNKKKTYIHNNESILFRRSLMKMTFIEKILILNIKNKVSKGQDIHDWNDSFWINFHLNLFTYFLTFKYTDFMFLFHFLLSFAQCNIGRESDLVQEWSHALQLTFKVNTPINIMYYKMHLN